MMMQRQRGTTLFPYTTLFRSWESRHGCTASCTAGCSCTSRCPWRCLCSASPMRCCRFTTKRISKNGDWLRVFERSEEHTSELQSQFHLVCRLLLEKKKELNNI